jgi:pantothenate kinase type III
MKQSTRANLTALAFIITSYFTTIEHGTISAIAIGMFFVGVGLICQSIENIKTGDSKFK